MTAPTDGIPLLEVRSLHIRFPAMKRHFFDRQRFVHAADDVSFTLERGRTLGLVGESGSGKTTVARGVMRLVKPASGDVLLDGESVLPLHGDALSAFRRRVQFIFQDPYSSLNPRSRAGDIIREPMELLNVGPREERGGEVLRLMEAVGLRPDQARLFPHQFSGGQRQRIAIARALAPEPELLLLDEPLGALDLQLRRQMQLELKRLQKKLGITFVYITHDQEEAINMSDRIAVMRGGRFEQLGTPEEIYDEPKTHYVAQFIGRSTILSGRVEAVGKDTAVIRGACGSFTADASRARLSAGEDCEICVRTERMRVSPVPVEGFQLPVTVREARYAGGSVLTYAILPDGEEAVATSEGRLSDALTPGSTAYLYWNPAQAAVIGGTSHGA